MRQDGSKRGEEVKRHVLNLWMDGKDLSEIRNSVMKEFGLPLSDSEILELIPQSGSLSIELPKSPDDVIGWLYEWQLERLGRYRELERSMNLPIPDVKANIALMLQILERVKPKEISLKEILGLEGVEE